MLFAISYMCSIFGGLLAGIAWLLPSYYLDTVHPTLRLLLFVIGFVLIILPTILIHSRALKTTLVHILEPGSPWKINWMYVYKDGEIIFTPSFRAGGKQLYNEALDAQLVADPKAYKIFDHNIRVVPEGLAFSQDLDYVLQAEVYKGRWGFENMRELREGFKGKLGLKKEILPQEKIKVINPPEEAKDEQNRC